MAYTKDKETLEAERAAAQRRAAIDSYIEDSRLTQARSAVTDRKAFDYDPTKDPLYLQARDSYKRQGKLAMADTMGQAAALNGGYGTSYAAAAGQQTYNGYMQQLNDLIPDLAATARSSYDADTQALMQKYSLLYGEDADRRSALRSDYETALEYYLNQKNFSYGKYRDDVSDSQWQTQLDYQKERDKVSDSQWQKQYDLQKEQSSVGTGSATGGGTEETEEYTYTKFKDLPDEMKSKMSGMGSSELLSYLLNLNEKGIIDDRLSEVIYQTFSKDSDVNAKDFNAFLRKLKG